MKTIGILALYFGKLPNNFKPWLESCRTNPTIQWLVFTDDKEPFNYPENVKVHYVQFGEIAKRIADHYDFEINIDQPYKLTDYKVAYGDIFSDYLKEFDFWGFCDMDMIFGNIRKFIHDDLLDQYDKVLSNGHLTLFRNVSEINLLYQRPVNGRLAYKDVFSQPGFFHFDEWGHDGINCIAMEHKVRMYMDVRFHDVYPRRFRFYSSQLRNNKDHQTNNVYLWEDGTLWRFFLNKKGELNREEILYVHFQKRPMKIRSHVEKATRFLMTPNRYLALDKAPQPSMIVGHLKKHVIDPERMDFYFFHFKRKIKEITGLIKAKALLQ